MRDFILRECKQCGEAFKPRGRQLYCKPEHKRAHDVIARRQWRGLVRGVKKWVTAEDAREARETRAKRYLQLADAVDDYELRKILIFPDKTYELRRRREGSDVSNWPAVSAQYVWQLDGRLLRERDQREHGVSIVTATNVAEPVASAPCPVKHLCRHHVNGLPKRNCLACIEHASRLRASRDRQLPFDAYRGREWRLCTTMPREQ